MSEYETPISDLTIREEDLSNEILFNIKTEAILRLDKDGFHYKGQTIDDAGEAYRLFMHWMQKANGVSDDSLQH